MIDEITQRHNIIRLPPYHCQYNPIEYVLSEAKTVYASEGRRIENLIEKLLSSCVKLIFKFSEQEVIILNL